MSETNSASLGQIGKMPEEVNEYALLQFKREYSTPDDKEGTQEFQTVTFYKLNSDGSYENGTTLEELLAVGIKRLNDVNKRFPCRENSIAITNMEQALMWLEKRTNDRKARQVEGLEVA